MTRITKEKAVLDSSVLHTMPNTFAFYPGFWFIGTNVSTSAAGLEEVANRE